MNSFEECLVSRREMENKYPDLKDNRAYIIPQGDDIFWNFYHERKMIFKRAKLFVLRANNGDWILQAKPLVDPEKRKRKQLDEQLKKWQEYLKGCCLPFEKMCIADREKHNGVKQFTLFCPVCQISCTSEMPFFLVTYLASEKGLRIKQTKRQQGKEIPINGC